jgi:D-alanine--poly(phosphoribitol) ligase subunit 2
VTVAERVLRLLAEATATDDVCHDPDLPLFELNVLDSLATVDLLLAIQRELGLQISPAELDREQWSTPRKLVADVEHRLVR